MEMGPSVVLGFRSKSSCLLKKSFLHKPGQRTRARIEQKGDFVVLSLCIISTHIFLVYTGMPPPGHAGPWVEWQRKRAKDLAAASITPSPYHHGPQG